MKKIILLSCLLSTAAIQASAQLPSFTFGIKGGINVAKLKTDFADEENRTGYQVGVFSRIGAAGLYLQPELYLGTKGGKFSSIINASGTEVNQEDKVKFTTLDLPILLGTRVGISPLSVRFMAGPVISFVVNKDKPVTAAYNSIADFSNYKDQAIGIQAGAGIDISKLTLDVRYEAGITNVSESEKYDQKNNLWHISLGYKIF